MRRSQGQPPAFVVRFVLRVRTALSRLRRRVVPAEITIVETALALADTAALRTLAVLGVPDELASGSHSSADIADACGGVDRVAIHRLLRFSASRGLLGATRDGRFLNNRISSALRADSPTGMRNLALFAGSPEHFRIWGELENAVRTGQSACVVAFGSPFFDVLTSRPVLGSAFDGAMEALSRLQAGFVARSHDFSHVEVACDIGGGTGALLAEVLEANSELRGILFELPGVAEKAGPVLDANAVRGRVEIVAGSFFEVVPSGADRYLLQSVVHDWDDESCVQILTNLRDAVAPLGRVLVVEQVLPDRRGEHPAKTLDIEMLALTGSGHERTRSEFDALFARAGFQVTQTASDGVATLFELSPGPMT